MKPFKLFVGIGGCCALWSGGAARALAAGNVAGCTAVDPCAASATLTGSMALPNDHFGRSLAIGADVMVVGTPDADCARGLQCGEAYVLTWDGSTWFEAARLTAPSPQNVGKFGWSVAVHGGIVVVGTPNEFCASSLRTLCGAAYVFRHNGATWAQDAQLRAPDQQTAANFGYAVAAGQDVILVSAPSRSAVYVFRYDGAAWTEDQRIDVPSGLVGSGFGNAMAIQWRRGVDR